MYGKQARLPFEDSSSKHELMELVHSDICGPIQMVSLGGAKYIITFINHFSHYPMCYFLEKKDEQASLDAFKKYKAWVENQKGRCIKTLHTDGGGEYVNEEFRQFLTDNSISHEKTMRHTPQSNGLAKCMNRTLAEKTQSLLHGVNLPYKLWGEAWNTARYLYAKGPVKAHDSMPEAKFKSFNGRKLVVKHLKVYICIAFEHIPDALQTELQPKSKLLIFVSYMMKEKAY